MDILTFNGSGISSHSTTLHQVPPTTASFNGTISVPRLFWSHYGVCSYQQEDLAALGELLMCVALQSPLATKPENFLGSMEALAAHYSPEIHHILQ